MDPVLGGLIAAGAAWLSIALAIYTPIGDRLPRRPLRILGAITIALLGLQILGLPIPGWAPIAVFGGGLVVIVVIAPRGHAAAA